MREENLTKRNIYINLFPRITIYLYNFFFLIKFHIKKKKIVLQRTYLYFWYPEKATIKQCVHNKSNDIKRQVVEVKTYDALAFVITIYLWIKAYTPCQEIYPSDYNANVINRIRLFHCHSNECFRKTVTKRTYNR